MDTILDPAKKKSTIFCDPICWGRRADGNAAGNTLVVPGVGMLVEIRRCKYFGVRWNFKPQLKRLTIVRNRPAIRRDEGRDQPTSIPLIKELSTTHGSIPLFDLGGGGVAGSAARLVKCRPHTNNNAKTHTFKIALLTMMHDTFMLLFFHGAGPTRYG